jgi:purine-binding chemotaxis protein CheW
VTVSAHADGGRVLTFETGGQLLALSAREVAEVTPMPPVTRVPQAPTSLRGVASVRGKVTPIVSLSALLGGAGAGGEPAVIVLNRESPLALALDRVQGIDAEGATAARRLDFEGLLADAFTGWASRSRTDRAAPAATPAPPAEASLSFLEFSLAGQAYALPLEQIREVVKLEEPVTSVSRTDAVMLGVVPHRDGLLPLVSLKAALGLPAAGAEGLIVVARLGEAALGLVVDEVSSILRASERLIGPLPGLLNRGAGEAHIDAIVRTKKGLVSILATERLLREETIAQVIAEGAAKRASASETSTGTAKMEQFVLFRLGSETYGLPIAAVEEIVPLPGAISRVPRAPAFVLGVMNHRGEVVPLIDQRRRFDVSDGVQGLKRKVIICSIGDLTAGFVVDAIEEILASPAGSLQQAPDLAGEEEPLFDRVAAREIDGRLVLLVDPRQLLDRAERDLVRDLASGAGSS